jgi:tetratricopeptide (TPR) repeat protein
VSPAGCTLLKLTFPYLQHRDGVGLAEALADDWPAARLTALLDSGDADTVKLAVVCLSVTADFGTTPELAAVLHHDDPVAACLAEHALWATWFRAGSPEANAALRRAVELTASDKLYVAIDVLSDHIEREPDFAELYNQRAIAHFLAERFPHAVADCRLTVNHNPYHFGAWAGLGHCFTQLGEFVQARESYYEALRIHPRMAGIRETLRYLRLAIEKGTRRKLSAS